jgi:hypothetical protein
MPVLGAVQLRLTLTRKTKHSGNPLDLNGFKVILLGVNSIRTGRFG